RQPSDRGFRIIYESAPSTIVSHSCTNEIFQRGLIDFVAVMEINRSRFLSLKAGIEELVRIRKRRALKKVHLYCFLESAHRQDQSLVGPHGGAPFQILSELEVRIMNNFAKFSQHLAAPVGKDCYLLVDEFGRVHRFHPSVQRCRIEEPSHGWSNAC